MIRTTANVEFRMWQKLPILHKSKKNYNAEKIGVDCEIRRRYSRERTFHNLGYFLTPPGVLHGRNERSLPKFCRWTSSRTRLHRGMRRKTGRADGKWSLSFLPHSQTLLSGRRFARSFAHCPQRHTPQTSQIIPKSAISH